MYQPNTIYVSLLQAGKTIMQQLQMTFQPGGFNQRRIPHLLCSQAGKYETRFRYLSQDFVVRVELQLPEDGSKQAFGDVCLYTSGMNEYGKEQLTAFKAFRSESGKRTHILQFYPDGKGFKHFGVAMPSSLPSIQRRPNSSIDQLPETIIEGIQTWVHEIRIVPNHLDD